MFKWHCIMCNKYYNIHSNYYFFYLPYNTHNPLQHCLRNTKPLQNIKHRFHKEVQDLFPEFVQNKSHKFIVLKVHTSHLCNRDTLHKSIHKPGNIKQTLFKHTMSTAVYLSQRLLSAQLMEEFDKGMWSCAFKVFINIHDFVETAGQLFFCLYRLVSEYEENSQVKTSHRSSKGIA